MLIGAFFPFPISLRVLKGLRGLRDEFFEIHRASLFRSCFFYTCSVGGNHQWGGCILDARRFAYCFSVWICNRQTSKTSENYLGLLFIGSFITFFGVISMSGRSVEHTHYHQFHGDADDGHGQSERIPDFRPTARP